MLTSILTFLVMTLFGVMVIFMAIIGRIDARDLPVPVRDW